MAVRTYIGARYVPRFLGTYDATTIYDALDVVDNGMGTSYIAKKTVPAGTPLTDSDYWAIYGSTSAAILALQSRMDDAENDIDALQDSSANLGLKSVKDFGATGDGSTDDSQAFADALASGYPIRVPKGTYALDSPIVINGQYKTLYVDSEAILKYRGSDALMHITGHDHNITLAGEFILTNNPSYGIKYWSLTTSIINVSIISAGTVAAIYHDASADTGANGNNRWNIMRMECGGAPYGVKIDSSAYLYEGDCFDIKVIFSFNTCAFVAGSSDHNTVRFNQFKFAPDAQGYAGKLLEVNNSQNYFYIAAWACSNATKVTMNHEKNYVFVEQGTTDDFTVQLNGYKNFIDHPDTYAGIRDYEGQIKLNPKEGGATTGALYVGNNEATSNGDTGVDVLILKNKSIANNNTKYVGMLLGGYATDESSKIGCAIEAMPNNADWSTSHLEFKVNNKGYTGLKVNADNIVMPQSLTPGSPSIGEKGAICWDANNLYVKVDATTWKKAALVTV